jgi:phage gp36-like protein
MLLAADLKTHLYPELQTAIDRGDTSLIDTAIASAEGEAKGYLSRFDVADLFGKTGSSRDATLLMFLKDMAIWHFITLANPATDMQLRKTRYDDAIAWLNKIQQGKIVPQGWLAADATTGQDTYFHMTSATKRETRF